MNLAIFGATGGTGMSLMERAVSAGNHVRALARTPAKLDGFADRAKVIQGDVLDPRSVAETIVPGTDAVLSALGVPPFAHDSSAVLKRGMNNILAAMHNAGTDRVLAVSASALHVDSYDNLVLHLAKPVLQRLFATMYDDMRDMESELRNSSCDWTIVVPPQLNDKPPTGQYRLALGHNVPNGFSIRRADLARSMVDLIPDRNAFRTLAFVAN
jgi:putative NADH-flavin reductase